MDILKLLDGVFKYKIGDLLQLSALGEKIDGPTFQGYGSRTDKDKKRNSWLELQFSDPKCIYHVVERVLQQCHGGIQRHYMVRQMISNGVVERQLLQLTEDELIPANPFRQPKRLTKTEIIAYTDSIFREES